MAKTKRELISDKIYYVIRIGILLSVVFLFIPGVNPARVCGLVNKNISLFTAGISYSTLTSEFGRALRKGWVDVASTYLLYGSSLAVCIGIAANAACGCMSLGNVKLKKLGNLIGVIGSIAGLGGMVGIYLAYGQIAQTVKPNKVEPMFPSSFWLIVVLFAVILAVTIAQCVMLPWRQL